MDPRVQLLSGLVLTFGSAPMQTDILGMRPRGFNQWFVHCGPGYQSRLPEHIRRRDGQSTNQGHMTGSVGAYMATRLERTTQLERERRHHKGRSSSRSGGARWARSPARARTSHSDGSSSAAQRWASAASAVRRHRICTLSTRSSRRPPPPAANSILAAAQRGSGVTRPTFSSAFALTHAVCGGQGNAASQRPYSVQGAHSSSSASRHRLRSPVRPATVSSNPPRTLEPLRASTPDHTVLLGSAYTFRKSVNRSYSKAGASILDCGWD